MLEIADTNRVNWLGGRRQIEGMEFKILTTNGRGGILKTVYYLLISPIFSFKLVLKTKITYGGVN